MKAGRFFGFRIVAIDSSGFLEGVDLGPGDIIAKVNALPIEQPAQAQAVLESLRTAENIDVTYYREGEPRLLRYPIVDESAAARPAARSGP